MQDAVIYPRKEALTRDVLEMLLASCDDSLRGLRDQALLLFAWASGGRRRSSGRRRYAFPARRGWWGIHLHPEP